MARTTKLTIQKKVLSKNDEIAAKIRRRFAEQHILALNLVSSPGSGKTSLLEKTLAEMGNDLQLAVIAGDVQTENDAARLRKAGGKRIEAITTDGACHLDAAMVDKALGKMDIAGADVLFIENVGNLVCPSSFDLGEDMKVVLMSTAEGDDKPQKYPAMFRRSSVLIINKTDLLGQSDFDIKRSGINALNINPDLKIFRMACRTGEGLSEWYAWLRATARNKKSRAD
jgi:hydrogenase nickel incorporation protein HypB